MGRVDEAMRRAAEASLPRPVDTATDSVVSGPVGAEVDLRIDPFPSEVAERPRPRSIGPAQHAVAPAIEPSTAAPGKSVLLPTLAERITSRLQHKIVIDHDMDPASREQYRRLAAGLHAAQAASGLKVVMLASAVAGEGKSLTSSNLALTFSESYQRNVLLIDGDLRRPSLHTVFGLECSPGLSEGLLSADDRKLPLHRVSSNLTVLTAGEPTSDPMGALASERMQRLVEEARETFDWVVIDTPPIGLLSDASLLSQMVDGAILVVKAGSTPYDLVQRAVAALGRDRVLGVVLNRAEAPNAAGYRYYTYYGTSRSSTAQIR
jgi:capsular exopolysaccharide synthesis family protein